MKGWEGVTERPELAQANPLPDVIAHPWIFRCPKANCYYAVSSATRESAEKQEREHKCPYQGGITKIAGSITMTLVEDMWAKADKAYAAIADDGIGSEEVLKRKGVARGMAEMIAIFSAPHFRTGDEVVRELMKRAAGGSEYQTPGLGSRRFEPPSSKDAPSSKVIKEGDQVRHLGTGNIGVVRRVGPPDGIVVEYTGKQGGGFSTNLTLNDLEVVKGSQLSAKALSLSEKEIAAIKFAKESGAFTDAQIAQTYGIAPSEVGKIAAS